MAKVEYISVTLVTTGTEIIILNDPTLIVDSVILSVNNGSGQSASGYSDGINSYSYSTSYGDTSTTKPLVHYRPISSVKTKVLEIGSIAKDTGEFGINISTLTDAISLNGLVIGH